MKELWLFAVLGILMGVVGVVMIRVLAWLEDFFDELPIRGVANALDRVGSLGRAGRE